MVLQEGKGLIQFFQHAHHRVEGYLMDFSEQLKQGRREAEFIARAAEDLHQHMFIEEELLFPMVKEESAAAVANLEEEHGRICDLMEELQILLHREADQSAIQTCSTRLMGVLAAHNAVEDLGIYPDLLILLGPARASALLAEAERTEVPRNWACVARRPKARV
ncbi:MAG: hemerythrin domain-containing protein [Betaproteobacteria bacterium]|nr:hemerythrin domain-containing protein [Betaproteobacteria bacterium]